MTTDPSGAEEVARRWASEPVDESRDFDEERRILDDEVELPDHLDLPIETPEADALDQARIERVDDDDGHD